VCLELADILSGLAAADEGKWSPATVNVDMVPRVAQTFGVQVVPTVVAVGAGKPLSSFQGMQPADQLRRWLLSATAGKLSGATGSEHAEIDPALAQARQQVEAGDFAAATSSYQAILNGNPNHAEAKAAVRQMAFLTRATAQRLDAVKVADAAPNNIEACAVACLEQLSTCITSPTHG
jgi:putative thioredoxin